MQHSLLIKNQLLSLEKPLIMGVLNVTPDSFYDGGRYTADAQMLEKATDMVAEGVDIIDIGGYSSRPGADDIPVEIEEKRVLEAIKLIKSDFPSITISIDTFRAEVAEKAVAAGADIINDISGGSLDDKMWDTVAALQVPYIVMHMKGTPKNMVSLSHYENLLQEIIDYFAQKINQLHQKGIKDIIIDPGFGFAKNIDQNFRLLSQLKELAWLEKPIMVGLSRKSMIYKTLSITADQALNGTTALHTVALLNGANLLRVHDVKEAKEVVRLLDKIPKDIA